MTRFRYRAARADGRVIRGVVSAPSEVDGAAVLEQRGLALLDLTPGEDRGRWIGPSRRDLAVTMRGLASLVGAGAPITRALAATEHIPRHPALRAMLVDAQQELLEGRSLAAALARSGTLVPPVSLGILRAGEGAGRLGPALEQVAGQLELEAELGARLRQALAYPLVLAGFGSGAFAVIALVIVPRFAALLADLNLALPPATRLLLSLSHVVRVAGGWVLLALFAGVAGLISWRRRPEGRLQWDRLLLDVPVIGAVRHQFAAARLCRALSALLGAGVPLLTALEGAAEAAGDSAVGGRLQEAAIRIAQGTSLAASFERERVVPLAPLQLLAVGENSASLAAMAEKAGALAAQDAERSLRTAVGLLEPVLVVGFGALVSFVAAALLQAAYSLRPGG